MLRLTLVSLALLVCAVNANLFDSLLGGEEKQLAVINNDESSQQKSEDSENPSDGTSLAVISDDQSIASLDDLASEGQSGVVIRAKRYYGCGCCCGCATAAAVSTVASVCGCGCCGCGYG